MLAEWLEKEKGVEKGRIIYVTFEDREQLDAFSLNPKDFVRRFAPDESGRYYFSIDEVHYCRDVGQKLKLMYDLRENIKFIITGSSSMELLSETARFLVGRLLSFELLPFSFGEFLNAREKGLARMFWERHLLIRNLILRGEDFKIPEKDIFTPELLRYYQEFVLFGGYPEVIKARSEEEKKIVLKNIFNTYLEKDVISFLQITDTTRFRKLVSLLSSLTGEMINFETLCRETGGYYREMVRLLDILEQTYIVRSLRPFRKNLVTELRKNPKIYFLDCGMRNYAINNFNPLEVRGDAGRLAENFVFNELKLMGENLLLKYWRTTAKAEVDFVVDAHPPIPIEVKFGGVRETGIGRSLHSFLRSYSPRFAVVVTKDFWGERLVGSTKVKFVPIVYF